MSSPRRISALGVVLCAVLVGGCYGSTEPATDIGLDRATLNAYGSTEGTKTIALFKYWTPSRPNETLTTPSRDLPAGVRGPFREAVSRLSPGTEYSFQLCGGPDGTQGSFPCAQTRTFRTLPGDEVTADLRYGGSYAELRAVSGPRGEAARGSFLVHSNIDPLRPEEVVCLAAYGDEAVVGIRSSPSDTSGRLFGLRAGINRVTQAVGRDPRTCGAYRPGDLPASEIEANTRIRDAP